ncbi:MAG: exo-alpha-sialidase, partial [Thermoguttaceae bacterium]|nr:exo-alpha-sialidase [Thermoguttaceae bacterium]
LGCNAGLLAVETKEGENWLFYTGPQDSQKRINFSIMVSNDQGKSWTTVKNLTSDIFAAYSALAWSETEQKIVMLYETNKFNTQNTYGDIVYAEFNIAWVKQQLTERSSETPNK